MFAETPPSATASSRGKRWKLLAIFFFAINLGLCAFICIQLHPWIVKGNANISQNHKLDRPAIPKIYIDLARSQIEPLDKTMAADRPKRVAVIADRLKINTNQVDHNYSLLIGAERYDLRKWDLTLRDHLSADPKFGPADIQIRLSEASMLKEILDRSRQLFDSGFPEDASSLELNAPVQPPHNTSEAVTIILDCRENSSVEDPDPNPLPLEDKYDAPNPFDPIEDDFTKKQHEMRITALAWLFQREHERDMTKDVSGVPAVVIAYINAAIESRTLYLTRDIPH